MKNTNENSFCVLSEKIYSRITFWGCNIFISLLIFSFITKLPEAIHDWTSGWYAMDYSLGMGSRLLVGSFLKFIFPDFLYAKDAYVFLVITIMLLLIFLILLFAAALKCAQQGALRIGLSFLIILYLASPGSPAYLWSTENFGRFDTYLLFFTLLCVLLYMRFTSYPARCLILLLSGSLCLAIHQVYMFIFFPVIFIMLLLPLTFTKSDRKNLLYGTSVLFLLCIQFLYYQFFAALAVGSPEELYGILTARTDLPVMQNALYFEYFADFKEKIIDVALNEIGERIRYTAIAFFILSPIFILYGYLWLHIIKGEKNRIERIKYILFLLSLLSYIPAFALAKDWGRWTSALLIVLLLQIIIIIPEKKEAVSSAFQSLIRITWKLRYPLFIYVIFIACLKKYECILLPQSVDIFYFIYELLH